MANIINKGIRLLTAGMQGAGSAIWRLAFGLALCLLWAGAAAGRPVGEIPNVHVADSTQYVSNPDGVLSAAAVAELNARLGTIWRSTTAEPVVVAVAKMPDDTDIDTYATDIFEAWGIGKEDKSNGLLLVVARDDRKAVIRTGYGMEGVVPDVVAGRILRQEMFPRFREGDYDGGTVAAVDALGRVVTDPRYAEELRSSQSRGGEGSDELDLAALLGFIVELALLIALGALVWTVIEMRSTRKLGPVERHERLDAMTGPLKVLSFFSLGMGLLALWPVKRAMKKIRRGPRQCPNCATAMAKIDEEHDNDYLTPSQDAEERLNSVDYDVWVCPKCNETDVLPFVNRRSVYKPCPQCGARALRLTTNRILRKATTRSEGLGVRRYVCQNCNRPHDEEYKIPRDTSADIAAGAAAATLLGGRGGGGGFSGGSFGGGLTGGGGASGGW